MKLVLDAPERVLGLIYDALFEVPAERRLAEEHGIIRDKFVRTFQDSLVVGVEIAGELAGGMFFRGGAAHIGILRRFHGRWFRALKPMLEMGFERFGPRLIAQVFIANKAGQRFVEAVGCVRVRECQWYIEYEVRKEGMRYGRPH